MILKKKTYFLLFSRKYKSYIFFKLICSNIYQLTKITSKKKFFFFIFLYKKNKNILTLTKSTPSLHFHILVRFQTKINIFRFSCYGYKEQTFRHCIFYIHDVLFNIIYIEDICLLVMHSSCVTYSI